MTNKDKRIMMKWWNGLVGREQMRLKSLYFDIQWQHINQFVNDSQIEIMWRAETNTASDTVNDTVIKVCSCNIGGLRI